MKRKLLASYHQIGGLQSSWTLGVGDRTSPCTGFWLEACLRKGVVVSQESRRRKAVSSWTTEGVPLHLQVCTQKWMPLYFLEMTTSQTHIAKFLDPYLLEVFPHPSVALLSFGAGFFLLDSWKCVRLAHAGCRV